MSSSAIDTWLTYRGTALHLDVYESPGAPVIIFVPPFASTAASCARFCSLLRAEGFTLLALDLQGHGRSEGSRGHLPFGDALGNIFEAVAFATERFGAPVSLAGSGLGGIIALYASLCDDRIEMAVCQGIADLREVQRMAVRLRVRALLAAAPAVRRAARVVPNARIPASMVVSPRDMFDDPANVARWRTLPGAPRSYTLDTLASFFLEPDAKPAIETMTKPVFAVAGSEDRAIPFTAQQDAVARLPDAELLVLGGAGHMLAVEYAPLIVPRIAEWLHKRI